jgi:phenylalanyl-tRNA synthetase beta chain
VAMLNPLSNDLSVMRQSLLFSGLEAVSYNINRRNSDLKLFEFGKSYHKFGSDYTENKHLTLFVSGNRNDESWIDAAKPSGFFLFKGYIDAILSRLGLEKVRTQPVQSDVFAEGVALFVGEELLVEYGTVKKSILKHFDIKQEVLFADFNWNVVLKLISNKIRFAEIPKISGSSQGFGVVAR